MRDKRSSTASLVITALFAAVLAVCAWVAVPAAVPITLQTFGVYAALLLLGGRQGTIAVSVYLLLGAVGAPVFAGFRGGPGVLFGATGGYLVGFLLLSLLYWLFTARLGDKPAVRIAALVAGQLVAYLFGTLWFMAVYRWSPAATLMACVVPFLLPDALKLALALLVIPRLRAKISKVFTIC
jgi:biotin transport system substrate-specific component